MSRVSRDTPYQADGDPGPGRKAGVTRFHGAESFNPRFYRPIARTTTWSPASVPAGDGPSSLSWALRNKSARHVRVIFLLGVALVASGAFALRVGAVDFSTRELVGFLWRLAGSLPALTWDLVTGDRAVTLTTRAADNLAETILLQLRLPRAILAGLVGASLGISGAIFQALFRNPMADPYIIGVSSGAAFGAAMAMAMGLRFRILGMGMVPVSAFAGALVTLLVVYRLGKVGGRLAMLTLLLAGVAVGSFLSAMVSLLTYLSSDRLHQIVFWLMGGFGHASWNYVLLVLPYFAGGFVLATFHARTLNCLMLGEETAQYLGVEVEKVKRVLLVTGALLAGVSVAAGGVIGFVGLVVPHMIRELGGSDHRTVVPATALGGAALVVLADAAARWLIAPTELPVGLITASCGAPFFIYLLRKRGRRSGWA